MGVMCEYFVLPHIADPNTRQFYEQLSDNNSKVAKPEDFSRLISLLVKLPNSAKAKTFSRNLRDNQVSTLPRLLSDRDEMCYSKEQKEKDETLARLHSDFAPVLQILLHNAIDSLRTTEDDDVQSSAQLLSEC